MNHGNDFFPKRSLGQNFLVHPASVQRIIDSCALKPSDTVLEIGPGMGALTHILSQRTKHVVAIEKDKKLAGRLKQDFKSSNTSQKEDFKKYGIRATTVNLNTLDKNVYFHYVDQISLFPNTYIYQNSVAKSPSKAVKISDVFSIKKGSLQSTKATPGQYRFITASDEYLTHEEYTHDTEALVVAVAAGGSLGKPQYVKEKFIASDLCFILTPKRKKDTDLLFYLYYFKDIRPFLVKMLAKGVSKPSINKTDFSNLLIDSFDSVQQKNIGLEIRKVRASIKQYEENIQALEKKLIEDIDRVRNGK